MSSSQNSNIFLCCLPRSGRCFTLFFYSARLSLSKVNRHSTGLIDHQWSEQPPVTASTKEWAIRKRLYSTVDSCATFNIGRILGRRCLQAGIHTVLRGATAEEVENSPKVLSDSGFLLVSLKLRWKKPLRGKQQEQLANWHRFTEPPNRLLSEKRS